MGLLPFVFRELFVGNMHKISNIACYVNERPFSSEMFYQLLRPGFRTPKTAVKLGAEFLELH